MDEYAPAIELRLRELLHSSPDERDLQQFLEQNPALVPGARTPGAPSGHAPIHNFLISQPRLPGLKSKLPDFMWIAKHSQAWYPTLIEIERPNKTMFKNGAVPRAEFTQAHNQLAQWRAWFANPDSVSIIIREYGIPDDIIRFTRMKLHMILIYGRRAEFSDYPTISQHRAALVTGADEQLMSWDRLKVDKDLCDTITVKCVGSGQYDAVAIPPTFTLGPTWAHRLVRINRLDRAIERASISADRKAFLIRRANYWRNWALDHQSGLVNYGEEE